MWGKGVGMDSVGQLKCGDSSVENSRNVGTVCRVHIVGGFLHDEGQCVEYTLRVVFMIGKLYCSNANIRDTFMIRGNV